MAELPKHTKAVVRDGRFVSERVAQVVEAIREYSPELEVQWVPPDARDATTAAFRIMHYPPGKEPYIVMHVKNEEEFDSRVLMELIMGDQRNGRVTVNAIEAAETAAALVAKQRVEDEKAEMIDMMFHALRTPLNTYRINKDIVIKDGIPFNSKGY